MAVPPIQNVEVFDLAVAPGPPDSSDDSARTAATSPAGRSGPGGLIWTGGLLLLAAVLLCLLTISGTAYSATSTTPSQANSNCHEDLTGSTACDTVTFPSVQFTRRFDAWGTVTVTGTNSAGTFISVPVGATAPGVRLGLSYLIGGIGLALGAVALAAALRWPRRRALAPRVVFGAAAISVGITIAQIVALLGARNTLEYNDPSTAPEQVLKTTFAVGSSAILGLLATVAAVAAAVVVHLAFRTAPAAATPVAASSITA